MLIRESTAFTSILILKLGNVLLDFLIPLKIKMTLKFITQFVYRNVFLAGIKENNVISTNPIVVDAMLPMMAKHPDI